MALLSGCAFGGRVSGYRRVARPASRKVAPDDPGEVRSCPKVPEQVANSCSNASPAGEIRPRSDSFQPVLTDLGLAFVEFRPGSSTKSPISGKPR